MSTKAYREAYEYMTDKQKEAMYTLYQNCINHDGHSWATFTDIENAVAEIVMAQKNAYEEGYEVHKDKYRWHDLRKNSEDLPKEGHKQYLCKEIYWNPNEECYEDQYIAYWFVNGNFMSIGQRVEILAWKEIEEFEEEE